ncbi:MAG TPA: hypothetical protein VGO25_06035 [Rhodanobacteraceae bacterium]|jgi:hypothetical protein|nr:hypothetical protein [Rhodanobacteraceae bacterium]
METIAADAPDSGAPADENDPVSLFKTAVDEALRVSSAALALLRAELRLARSSAFVLVWLSFALVFLGVGAWLATSAAIAAGVYQLTGNMFYGIGSVALANILGVILVLFAMRGCWRDLALPRTRRAIADFREAMS